MVFLLLDLLLNTVVLEKRKWHSSFSHSPSSFHSVFTLTLLATYATYQLLPQVISHTLIELLTAKYNNVSSQLQLRLLITELVGFPRICHVKLLLGEGEFAVT